MRNESIYVLHKNGADSHYTALKLLLEQEGYSIKYREFSVISQLIKGVFKGNFILFRKQIINLFFLINLFFTKNKRIVLGIAPFDYKLKLLMKILKGHKVYYHTSWTYWDKTFHPKTKRNTNAIYKEWKLFLEKKTKHIFAVSERTKKQLLENYNISECKISIVYHSIDPVFSTKFKNERKPNSFIYFGRLVPQKGINEILEYFQSNKQVFVTLIGDGDLKGKVIDMAKKNNNISYFEKLTNKKELAEKISKHEFLILNSKRNEKWEELFGLAIIESMAQGVIPISSNHSGPKEIITKEIGYVFIEGELKSALEHITANNTSRKVLSKNSIKESKKFLPENIAPRWKPILK